MSRAEFYRLVSAVLRERLQAAASPEQRAAGEAIARDLCDAFAQRNTKFDAVRFLRDSGVADGAESKSKLLE